MKFIIKTIALSAILITSCSKDHKDDQTSTEKALLAHTEAIVATPKVENVYVTANSGLSLREGTNLRSKKVLTLPYGAEVKVLSRPSHTTMTVAGLRGDMVEVEYQGAKGFAFDGYLSLISPPLEDEAVSDYAQRISTYNQKVNFSEIPDARGEAFGLTKNIEVPTNNFEEAYSIAATLFDIPKGVTINWGAQKTTQTYINRNKREKTLLDEVVIKKNEKQAVESITYTYKLKEYEREISMTSSPNGILIVEKESVL